MRTELLATYLDPLLDPARDLEGPGGSAFSLRFLRARRPEIVGRPFLAAYDPQAQWWDELHPFSPHDRAYFDPSTIS